MADFHQMLEQLVEAQGLDPGVAARLLPGTYGWFLEPEPTFRQAWNLNEYVYTAEYVATQ